jgi:prolyl-tRNA synthetase
MRMTDLFGRTLREAPADSEGTGWQLLQRAGYARSLGRGRYAYLPLGQRALARLAASLHVPLEGQRRAPLELPPVGGADLPAVARELARSDIQSYRQLPVSAIAQGTWRRDRSQGRGGPLNALEAPALFSIRLDGSEDAAQAAYRQQQQALCDLFTRCGLAVITAAEPIATVAGHAYLYLSDDAADSALLCDACGYAALADVAAFSRPPAEPEPALPLEKIATPHTSTIAGLAQLLGVPKSRTAKAVFLMAAAEEGEQFVFAVVRGDMDVSERKLLAGLSRIGIRATGLRAATDAEIRPTGAMPGYASPVGPRNVTVVVDELIPQSPNLVAGANEDGYHLLNTNYGRDYSAKLVAGIAAAEPGDGCPRCSSTLRFAPIAVLAQSECLPVEKGWSTFLDASGRAQPVLISVVQLDLGALLTAVAEKQRDEQGLIMPPAAAPFAVHLVGMPGAEAETEGLYRGLWDAGIACLWDDRSETAGVKFTDADLIGAPVRITLGKRSLQSGGAEFKRRHTADKWIVPLDAAVETVRETLGRIEADIVAGVKELPYGEYLR